MFYYMGKSREDEAIFIDPHKNDFSFLLKIVEQENNKTFILSIWYKDNECTLETINTVVPQEKNEEAHSFFHEVLLFASMENPLFISALEEYTNEINVPRSEPDEEEHSNSMRP